MDKKYLLDLRIVFSKEYGNIFQSTAFRAIPLFARRLLNLPSRVRQHKMSGSTFVSCCRYGSERELQKDRNLIRE